MIRLATLLQFIARYSVPLPAISQYLVDHLQALPMLDGRYSTLALVNFDSVQDQRRGCFSLVFRAIDGTSGREVALKFFDPSSVMDVYRLSAFRRESDILAGLVGAPRCLQLISNLKAYQLPVTTQAGVVVPLPCEYFATEWIEDEIDEYFLSQDQYSALQKLILFQGILSAVTSLHSRGIFHRDLKPDNLRAVSLAGAREIVAIDLGTAARLSSAPIQNGYFQNVGAPAYSSPEALCGLAGNRRLASYSDLYALGCMLFELFNQDLHIQALHVRNNAYPVLLAILAAKIDRTATDQVQQNEWDSAIRTMAHSFVTVPINGAGSAVPPGIAPLLNEVLAGLTDANYRQRMTLSRALVRVGSAVRLLQNEHVYRRRLDQVKAARQRRIENIERRKARLGHQIQN